MKGWGWVAWGALVGCAARPAAPDARPPPATPDAPRAPWTYDVTLDADGGAFGAIATFPGGSGDAFTLDDDGAPYTGPVQWREPSGAWSTATARDTVWTLPCTAGCVVRYRFRLNDAARALRDPDSAMLAHDAVEAPPSTWLLRPATYDPRTPYRFHVRRLGGAQFATGVHPVDGEPDTWGATADDIESAPYTLFGKLRLRTLKRSDATIDVAVLDGAMALDDAAVDHWIDVSARAVTAFYGHFPVPRLLLAIAPSAFGGDTAEGRTLSGGGSTILLGVSERMTAADIPRDWVLTHEMTHLASPSLPRSAHWLEEGMATYIEPLARVEAGTLPADEVWRGLVEGLPNGEPEAGDQGLDNTHTWGRTYWGGAMFCLLADVEIRKATGNRASLQTALRGVLDHLGSGEVRASLEDELRAGDTAAGVHVLEELHARLGEKPERVDLDALWRELGVREVGGRIAYDQRAKLAAVREGIVAR